MGVKAPQQKLDMSKDGAKDYLNGAVTVSPLANTDMILVGQSVTFNNQNVRLSSRQLDAQGNAKFTLESVDGDIMRPKEGEKLLNALGFRGKELTVSDNGSITFTGQSVEMSSFLSNLKTLDGQVRTIQERTQILNEWLMGNRDSIDLQPAMPPIPPFLEPSPPAKTPAPASPYHRAVPDPSHGNRMGALDINPAQALGGLPSPSGERSGGARGLA